MISAWAWRSSRTGSRRRDLRAARRLVHRHRAEAEDRAVVTEPVAEAQDPQPVARERPRVREAPEAQALALQAAGSAACREPAHDPTSRCRRAWRPCRRRSRRPWGSPACSRAPAPCPRRPRSSRARTAWASARRSGSSSLTAGPVDDLAGDHRLRRATGDLLQDDAEQDVVGVRVLCLRVRAGTAADWRG